MAITVAEAMNSREWGGDGSCTMRYLVHGTANDYVALTALVALLPAAVTRIDDVECVRSEQKPSLTCVWADEVTADGMWTSEVVYKAPGALEKPEPNAIGSLTFTFDTTGGTQHLSASLVTRSVYAAPAETYTPNYQGAIGVTEDGTVEGVDVALAVFNLRAEMIWDPSTPPDADDIYDATGTVNANAVTITDTTTAMSLTFQPGELLFRGASMGTPRGDGGIPVTYNFEAIKNESSLTLGPITGIVKAGWDYLWVRCGGKVVSPTSIAPTYIGMRPRWAYVEQVLRWTNLVILGIFT